jgi:WD40 repeat protein
LSWQNLNRPGVAYCAKITHDENAITNAIEIYDDASGGTRLMSSNNDSVVRVFDCEVFSVLSKFEYKWPVNHTSVSPDGKLVVVVGDNTDSLLADTQSGKAIANLTGHVDYSFASAWHPDGYVFATGNQDTTCRLWDARNLSQSLTVLKGRIGAIRSIRFSADGRFMAMAEPADFVHIFDTKQDYNLCQEVDIFGEVAGISFSPDTEALFVGVADRTYGSLLEFNRCHANMYLDSYI